MMQDPQIQRPTVAVMAGSFWTGGAETGLSDGFRQQGWIVHQVDWTEFAGRHAASLAQRVLRRLATRQAAPAYQAAVVDACERIRPELFLTVKGTNLSRATLRRVRELGARTVMVWPDYFFEQAGVDPSTFEDYDHFVTTKSFQLEHLRARLPRAAVHYVPHGYVDRVHCLLPPRPAGAGRESDLLYVANHNRHKGELVSAAIRLLPGTRLTIAGAGWAPALTEAERAAVRLEGLVTGLGYTALIHAAKVNVAYHAGPAANGWSDLVSTRTFEIPACGGFMLHADNDEVREFFAPGTEIDVFSTPEEFADKARFYLDRPALREAMAARAHARCVPAYGYAARSREIAGLLGAPVAAPGPDRLGRGAG